jgi:hypothetical protein
MAVVVPPSVLWIVTTQWRAQACGYAGDPNARTPHLDALASQSINYTQAVTPHPFGPFARAALLTGIPSPQNGVRDYYATVRRQFAVPALGNVTAQVAYHEFDSAFGGLSYGSEWDASLGFRLGTVNLMAKYANYDSSGFAVDTEKFWLQAEWGF